MHKLISRFQIQPLDNTSTVRLRDITGQLWWRNNDALQNIILGYNGELSDQ